MANIRAVCSHDHFLPSYLERFQCRYVFMLGNRMLKGSTVLKVNFMRLNVSKARKCKCTVGYY